MNGAKTGMAAMVAMLRLIRQVLLEGFVGFVVAVAGAMARCSAARRIDTTSRGAIATAT